LLTKDDLKELRKIIAPLPQVTLPKNPRQAARVLRMQDIYETRRYSDFWNHITEHGREPFQYKWSGWAINPHLFDYLQCELKIDLRKSTIGPDDEYIWYLWDKKTKATEHRLTM
jgi:hypothetical protein